MQTQLTAPVLQLVGEGDRFTPAEMLRGAEEFCGGECTLKIVPGVGHYPAEEAPELVNETIVEFLSGLS